MSEKKKKLFPKLKKKISDFLTDESWEITKKDALGISAGAVLLVAAEGVIDVEQVSAGHWSHGSHSNSWNPYIPWITAYTNPVCSHVSWIVNGHVSSIPKLDLSKTTVHNHSSGSIHGSHGSHWSRW